MIKTIHHIRSIFFVFYLLFVSFLVTGQDQVLIDSLKASSQIEKDNKQRVDMLNSIAEQFGYMNADSAKNYIYEALQLSQKIDYKKGLAESYFQLSYFLDQEGKSTEAIEYLEKAAVLFKEAGDSSYLVGCYNNLGVFYSYDTNQTKSLEYFIQAMRLAENLDDKYSLAEAYINIGSYFEFLEVYSSALKYYLKSIDVYLLQNDNENLPFSHLYAGAMYVKLHRFEEAYQQFQEARKLLAGVKDKHRKTDLYMSMADYFLETNQPDSSCAYIELAREHISTLNFPRLKADIVYIEASIEKKRKNYSSSLEFYNQALGLYKELNLSDNLNELYNCKAEIYSALGEHNRAYDMLQKAIEAKKSYHPSELAKLLGEFESEEAAREGQQQFLLQQELKSKERENDLIQYRANLQVAVFSIVLLLLLLIFVLLYLFYRRKHTTQLTENLETINRQKKLLEENYAKLEELNATRDKFFSIIAHDLKNPFNVLIGLSDAILSNPDIKNTKDFDELVEGIFHTSKSGYNLLENLLEWSRTQTGSINFDPHRQSLHKIILQNQSLYLESGKAKNISIEITGEKDLMVNADYHMVNFIVRNLLNNAIKFSFEGNKIEISTKQKNDFVIISVKDKGTGISAEMQERLFKIGKMVQKEGTANEKGTGLGLILCKEFVEKNGGKIWVKSSPGEGSEFCFSLPLFKT